MGCTTKNKNSPSFRNDQHKKIALKQNGDSDFVSKDDSLNSNVPRISEYCAIYPRLFIIDVFIYAALMACSDMQPLLPSQAADTIPLLLEFVLHFMVSEMTKVLWKEN